MAEHERRIGCGSRGIGISKRVGGIAAAARRKVEMMSEFDVMVPEVEDVLAAIDIHRLHGFSFWDALLVRAAKRSGCRVLLTEDLQHLRDVDGVKIVNPFRRRQVYRGS